MTIDSMDNQGTAQWGKRAFLKSIGLIGLNAFFPGPAFGTSLESAYHHVVVLGDLHLAGSNMEVKRRVLETVNSWADAEIVVALGDLCEESGSNEEYETAREFFAKLKKPLLPVVGNHDFIYSWFKKGTKSVRGNSDNRGEKLQRFQEVFGLASLYYSKRIGRYSLVFLSTDSPGHLAEISQKQLEWLRAELDRNRQRPTIIFFHAPLEGTLRNYSKKANASDSIAQPSKAIHDLLQDYPQVFLWVSGHTHTSPREESFVSAINVYGNRVTNIHNTDMQDRATVWTNSLFLYPDRVVVKTFDHSKGSWMPVFERRVETPTQFSGASAFAE